jgi:NAD(P)H-nitrite reductase large subunit
MTDDTVVCRCEQVTAGTIRRAVRAGTPDLSDVKKRTRAGMGYCQGANCGPAIGAMLHREFAASEEAAHRQSDRPPVRPVPLSLLMAGVESAVDDQSPL